MKIVGLSVFVFVAKLALELRPEQGEGGDGKTDGISVVEKKVLFGTVTP